MSDAQIALCVKRSPIEALEYSNICNQLSDIQFDECLKQLSSVTIRYMKYMKGHIPHRMNPYQKAAFDRIYDKLIEKEYSFTLGIKQKE
jgi:hypothetical protein